MSVKMLSNPEEKSSTNSKSKFKMLWNSQFGLNSKCVKIWKKTFALKSLEDGKVWVNVLHWNFINKTTKNWTKTLLLTDQSHLKELITAIGIWREHTFQNEICCSEWLTIYMKRPYVIKWFEINFTKIVFLL